MSKVFSDWGKNGGTYTEVRPSEGEGNKGVDRAKGIFRNRWLTNQSWDSDQARLPKAKKKVKDTSRGERNVEKGIGQLDRPKKEV